MMKKIQLFRYSIILLVLLNLGILAFFILKKPPHPNMHRPPFENRAVEILNLDKNQQGDFEQLVKKHRSQMEDFNKQQSGLLGSYFKSLSQSDSNKNDSLLAKIQKLDRQKIEATYQHFEEVKALLNSSQEDDFEEFMEGALEQILLHPKKGPPPPKDF